MTTPATHTCATIAHCILGDPTDDITHVGHIRLLPHQRTATRRIRAALPEFGGALLCDEVGLGKTYVALATATNHTHLRIIAPAVLQPMWHDALNRAQRHAEFISIESLSNPTTPLPNTPCDFVIVDEAHHARTPSAKRYTALSELCGTADILLLSATPIHNTHNDLIALLTLIVGDRAPALTPDEISRLVIRRTHHSTNITHNLPTLRPTQWTRLSPDSTPLEAIQTLPPSVPPAGSALAHTLLVHSLTRQWASSEAALRAAIQRRLSKATALLAALNEGRYPSANDLLLWTHATDSLQLAFPTLLPPTTTPTTELAKIVDTHTNALKALLQQLLPHSLTDHYRATLIRNIRRQHPNERIIAFSQYTATINALFRALRNDGHTAALTATGGLIASGPISRTEILSRFTSTKSTHHTRTTTDITLLLTTDLLSEGVNLQTASVVIHLDLPWTAARLEQRVGRVARIGSRHNTVSVYGFLPPTNAETLIRNTAIIHTKANITHTTIGSSTTPQPHNTPPSIPELTEAIHQILQHWNTTTPKPISLPQFSSIEHPHPGLLAACQIDHRPILLASTPLGTLSNVPADIHALIREIDPHTARTTTPSHTQYQTAQTTIHHWFTQHRAAYDAGVSHTHLTHRFAIRKRALIKHVTALATAPTLTHRANISPLLIQARQALTTPLAPFAERSFATPPQTTIPSFVQRAERPQPPPPTNLQIVALLLLAPPR